MYFLGNQYEEGKGVAANDSEAAKWYAKAAAKGNANSCTLLGTPIGILTLNGTHVNRNPNPNLNFNSCP